MSWGSAARARLGAVISYVLGNEPALRDYVAKRTESTRTLRAKIERNAPTHGMRQRRLARRQQANGA